MLPFERRRIHWQARSACEPPAGTSHLSERQFKERTDMGTKTLPPSEESFSTAIERVAGRDSPWRRSQLASRRRLGLGAALEGLSRSATDGELP